MRSVRPSALPWRPMKLRLLVLAEIWRPTSLSGFMPRHIEQPALPPLEAGRAEHVVEPLRLRLRLHLLRARHHDGLDARRDPPLLRDLRRGAKVAQPRVGAASDEDDVHRHLGHLLAGAKVHVGVGPLDGRPVRLVELLDRGERLPDPDALSRGDAPGHGGGDVRPVHPHHVVVLRIRVRGHRLPVRDGPVPRALVRGVLASAEVIEGGLVGVDVADPRPALDGHVAHRHPPLHGHRLDDRARVLVGEADTALDSEAADDVQGHVLRLDSRPERPADLDAPHPEGVHAQALRGEHVAHLARADAEGEGAEGAVGGGVGVAAGDRHAGVDESELGADDVHDALAPGGEVEELDVVALRVDLEGGHHRLRLLVGVGPRHAVGGDDVVDGRHRPVEVRHPEPAFVQHVEGLRGGDLVGEVQADEELVLPGREPGHDVRVPDLVVERVLRHLVLARETTGRRNDNGAFAGKARTPGADTMPEPRAGVPRLVFGPVGRKPGRSGP